MIKVLSRGQTSQILCNSFNWKGKMYLFLNFIDDYKCEIILFPKFQMFLPFRCNISSKTGKKTGEVCLCIVCTLNSAQPRYNF